MATGRAATSTATSRGRDRAPSNTLSSKSVDNRTTQAAVELKVAIEQMREQVQNIE
jgi:uncharacterized protein (TIGR00255 family)